MSDFGFRINLTPYRVAALEMDRLVDRASMWALREVGRQTKRIARRNAPVLTGRMQKSITSRRNLKKLGAHHYRNTVGPRGYSHLYAPQREGEDGFMAAAAAEASGRYPQIYENAQRNVLRRYG